MKGIVLGGGTGIRSKIKEIVPEYSFQANRSDGSAAELPRHAYFEKAAGRG